MNKNISFYHQHAQALFEQYQSANFIEVHSDWLHLLPNSGTVLDVGAGSGRDSAYMASKGLLVTAVEPADHLRALASSTHLSSNIHWLNDTLPLLGNTVALHQKYDIILLSAVWMHLDSLERRLALDILGTLLNPTGAIIITLRHGDNSDERVMLPVSYQEIVSLLQGTRFTSALLSKCGHTPDLLGRKNVSWQTVKIHDALVTW